MYQKIGILQSGRKNLQIQSQGKCHKGWTQAHYDDQSKFIKAFNYFMNEIHCIWNSLHRLINVDDELLRSITPTYHQ